MKRAGPAVPPLALAAADALSRGQLARAATLYARAARSSATGAADSFPYEKSAISLWLAVGDRAHAGRLAAAFLRSSRRRTAAERAWLELRLGEILWAGGDEQAALERFVAAARRLGRRDATRFEAELGAARCELRAGALRAARGRIAALRRSARFAATPRIQAEASLLAAHLASRTGSAAAVRRAHQAALEFVARHDLPAIECRILLHAARGALAWERPEVADAWAERAQRVAARLRDTRTSADAAVLRAAVCVSLAERTEESQGSGTAAGLRRDAEHHLGEALAALDRGGNPARLGAADLLAARLALLEAPPRARRVAAQARAAFRRAGLPEHEALAELLRLASGPERGGGAEWRRLARAAEGRGFSEIASRAWLGVARRAGAGAHAGRRHALVQSYRWSLRPTPGGMIPLAAWHDTSGAGAARLLAADALAFGPEPKLETLGWVLAARAAESMARGSPAERPRPLPIDHPETLYGAARAARLERALDTGRAAGRRAHETILWRRQLAYFRHLGSRRFRDRPPDPPRLPPDQALVLFARLADGVHAWCVRGADAVYHAARPSSEEWQAAAVRLEREAREARGWPDAMVPETLSARARRAFSELGSELWTPLLPALRGVSRLLLLPDPELPFLPFAALLLAADPASGPGPRSLSLLAAPPGGAPEPWRLPRDGVLAFSSSHPDHLLGAREARGAARVLGGRVLAGERFARARTPSAGGEGRPSPAALVRSSRLLYLAAPLRYDALRPFLSHIELDGMELDLDQPLDRATRLSLLVLPSLEPEAPDGVAVGHVVGNIGPLGARAYQAPVPRPEIAADPTRFLAALLRESAERVLAGTEPETSVHPSPVPGAFCAGLARGDTPAEALFLAQRHAWDEGLHPVLWSGFSVWERG